MKHTKTHQKELFTALGAVLTMAIFVSSYNYFNAENTDGLHFAAPSEKKGAMTMLERRAERLSRRLALSGEQLPEGVLEAALLERQAMLERSVTVHVESEDGKKAAWTFKPSAYPGLLIMKKKWAIVTFEIDRDALAHVIKTTPPPEMQALIVPRMTETKHDGYINRANADAVARAGFNYNADALATSLSRALTNGVDSISLTLPYEEAHIEYVTASGTQMLTLLGTGVSDYSDSPENRISNVHKAINERVNNVAVKPGEKFSFVATLGGPVTLDKGWKDALGLFGGGTALTPGGGICQAATTVFRAALMSGLPITERRNHSVFVDHYEPYGVGLDATIFPGVHDLSFKNDTSSIIVMQAYTEGDDVFVHFYGKPDNRTVTLDGPYFTGTKSRAKELAPLSHKQIGWVYHVDYGDGRVATRPFVATYHTGFMRSVSMKYAGTPGTPLLRDAAYDARTAHAAAPQQ